MRLSEQQTSYAAAVSDLGLERGREGSTAKYERVKRHYAGIGDSAEVQIETPPMMGREAWAADQNRKLDSLRA